MSKPSILTSQLSRLLAGTFLVRVFAMGATFLCSVLLARTLGVEYFGIYSYVLAVVSLLALPAQAGMPTLVLRETARAKALDDWSKMKGIWFWSGLAVLAISITVYFVVILMKGTIFKEYMSGFDYSILSLGLLMSLLVAMGNVRGAALRGLGLIIQGQLPESLIRPLLFATLMLITVWFNIDVDPTYAMGLHLVAATIAFIFGAWLLFKARPEELKQVKPIFQSKAWLFTILPLAMMTGMQSLSGQVDILMLGFLSTISNVGVYKVVVSGAALAIFGLQVVSMVITPRIASAYAKENYSDMQRVASIGSLLSFAMTIPVVIIFYCFGAEILDFVYGSEYAIGYHALFIIAVGQSVNAFFGSSISILTMSGNERFVIKGMLLSVIINILLNIVLIPKFGINGAAIGVAVSLLVWNLYLWLCIKKQINIDCTFIGLILRRV